MGSEAAKELIARGHEVTSIALPPLPQGAVLPPEMKIEYGNYLEMTDDEIRAHFKDCEGFVFAAGDNLEYKQVSICAEQPAESIIEDKGDILILVLTRPVDGKYRCQDCFYFFGVFHDGYKTSLISMEI